MEHILDQAAVATLFTCSGNLGGACTRLAWKGLSGFQRLSLAILVTIAVIVVFVEPEARLYTSLLLVGFAVGVRSPQRCTITLMTFAGLFLLVPLDLIFCWFDTSNHGVYLLQSALVGVLWSGLGRLRGRTWFVSMVPIILSPAISEYLWWLGAKLEAEHLLFCSCLLTGAILGVGDWLNIRAILCQIVRYPDHSIVELVRGSK